MSVPGSIRLFRFRGIDLNIHYSLLLLLAYIVIVASVQVPSVAASAGVQPGDLLGTPFAWGLLFAFGLFASVALHEFGHSLVAQSMGVAVHDITLMMLGGVSHMERIPDRRFAEFKMAIVGPLVSLVLAALFLFIHAAVGTASPNILLFSYWMGSANLALAIFNLLPAFPLDGGRALRSLLAVKRGQVRATQTAVSVSRGFAWFFGVVGLLQFNLLLLLIAFFIYSAAQSELLMVVSREALADLKVSDVLLRTPVLAELETLDSAANEMLLARQVFLPVARSNGGAGVISLDRMRSVDRRLWETLKVRDAMEAQSKTVRLEQPLSEVFTEIAAARHQLLPVEEDGKILGIVRLSDVADVARFKSLEREEKGEEQRRRAA